MPSRSVAKTGRLRRYRVTFLKKVTSGIGNDVDVCQAVIEVRAVNRARAIELARNRFAELRNLKHWWLHADRETIEEAAASSKPLPVR